MSPSRADLTHANTVCRNLGILATNTTVMSRTEIEGISVRVHRQGDRIKVFIGQGGQDAAAGGSRIPYYFKVHE